MMDAKSYYSLKDGDKREIDRISKSIGNRSVQDLITGTRRLRPGKLNLSNTPNIKSIKMIDINIKKSKSSIPAIEVLSYTKSIETSKIEYVQQLYLYGLDIVDRGSKSAIEIVGNNASDKWYVQPAKYSIKCMCRCTCPDFQHTFMYPNHLVNALIGQPIPYTPVPGSNRLPRNPKSYPGMCKHLHQLIYVLRTKSKVLVR